MSFTISQNNLIRYDDLAFIVAKLPAPQNVTATRLDADQLEDGAAELNKQLGILPVGAALLARHRGIREQIESELTFIESPTVL